MLPTYHMTIYSPMQFCISCLSPLLEPPEDHDFFSIKNPSCLLETCDYKRTDQIPCVFNNEPNFSVRGLCEDAVMDIHYKFLDHKPMNQSENLGMADWGYDNTRGYVGPKGWTISRSPGDKLWRMEHISYEELSLTMLDMDALPVGRHQWRIENNVCNQGETSIETLLISGCQEDQYTCDDGKCLNINQRCNNIEVSQVSLPDYLVRH